MSSSYPNESAEYRKARNALLEEEKALIEKVETVAEMRRSLPLGGKVPKDYTFTGASDDNLSETVRFSQLFGKHNALLLYSYMFGPGWDKPCPSCTSLIDGFDRAALSVSLDAAFTVVALAPAKRLNEWANSRGWTTINLVSAEGTDYLADYNSQVGGDEATLQPVMNVFTRKGDAIHHFWGTELRGNHVDQVWPYWNLMDMTPDGRPDRMTPPLDFTSDFLKKHYLDA